MAPLGEPLVGRAGTAILWRTLQLGSIKVIMLARTLILARLLVPEDFGLLAVSLIAIDFLVNITNFGMMPALVQREVVDERQYHAAWTVGIVRAVAIAVIVIIAAPGIAALLAEPRAGHLIRLMALRPVLEAAASAKVTEITRQLRFRALAVISVPEAVVNAAVSIALAPTFGVWALVAGTLVGPMVAGVMSYWLAPYRPRLIMDFAILGPLVQFGRWIYLSSLISVVGRALLQGVIVQRLGVEVLGLYYLAAKLAFIPAEITGEVVGAVAFPLYARLQTNPQQTTRMLQSLVTSLAALLFPVCALLTVLAPGLVDNLLGSRWQGTVELIQVLAIVNLAGLFGDLVSPVFKGFGRPEWVTLLEVIQSVVLISAIWTLASRLGVLSAGVAWLAAVSASQVASVLLIRRLLPHSLVGLNRPLLAIASASLAGGLIALPIASVFSGSLGVIAAGGLGLAVSWAVLWGLEVFLALGLANGFYRAFPQLALFFGPASTGRSWRS